MEPTLLIGDVAGAIGVNVQTVRYYERLGVLPRPERNRSGYRLYTPEAIQRMQFIREAQAAGFALEEIKEILGLHYQGEVPCAYVRKVAREKIRQVDRQMEDLRCLRRKMRHILNKAKEGVTACEGDGKICVLIQASSARKNRKRRRKPGERNA